MGHRSATTGWARRSAGLAMMAAWLTNGAARAADEADEAKLTALRTQLLGSWVTAVTDQPRLRLIEISAIERGAQGAGWVLSTAVGQVDGPLSPVRMMLQTSAETGRLVFRTARLEMVLSPADAHRLTGSYRFEPGAEPAGVTLERWPAAEIRARTETLQRRHDLAMIQAPGADVPPECAAFSGAWSGTWANSSMRPSKLWIMEVKADCTVRYRWSPVASPPGSPLEGRIVKGELLLPLTDGRTTTFWRKGDEVHAAITSPFVVVVHMATLARVR